MPETPGRPAVLIRRAEPGDLNRIAAIQAASTGAARWDVADYLRYDCWVAISENRTAGYLVSRTLSEGESEILDLAVAPEFRRRGIARALLQELLAMSNRTVFLEVRASNFAARNLYKCFGFQEVAIRTEYYNLPCESAIVMKLYSC
jgi:[ribosomal protein S18]-alanine N-acetyltransferase